MDENEKRPRPGAEASPKSLIDGNIIPLTPQITRFFEWVNQDHYDPETPAMNGYLDLESEPEIVQADAKWFAENPGRYFRLRPHHESENPEKPWECFNCAPQFVLVSRLVVDGITCGQYRRALRASTCEWRDTDAAIVQFMRSRYIRLFKWEHGYVT